MKIKTVVSLALTIFVLFSLSLQVQAQEEQDKAFHVYWDEGLQFETADGNFHLELGGRIHNDWVFISGDDELEAVVGPLENGTEFRRLRLNFGGEIHEHVVFNIQLDFANGEVALKDVYAGLQGLPGVGRVQAGHFKEPFSLEEVTSSNNITFMERSLGNVFAPSRNTGIMARNTAFDRRMTWALGTFRDTDDSGTAVGDGDFNLTGRLTGLPWTDGSGQRLLHLGFAYSHRSPGDNLVRFRQRPEVHLSPRFVDTESLPAESDDRIAAEAALLFGPASVQGEYFHVVLDRPAGTGDSFNAYYIQGSLVLTGEHRSYSNSSGAFGSVRPRSNFLSGSGNSGAWELAVRYSHLDLTDETIMGGKLDDFTLGLNWYLNPNARIMWNYVSSDRDGLGAANIFQMRFQINL
ncbi:MAG: OprO/OprP family phosphate-selective porin [Acidobacteriota bacterium]